MRQLSQWAQEVKPLQPSRWSNWWMRTSSSAAHGETPRRTETGEAPG